MILVTGATGNVGAEIVQRLRARDVPFKAAVRHLESDRLESLAGVPCVELDFERPDTLEPALRGVDQLFLMRPPALSDIDRYLRPAIDAAKAAGVRQIVFLSLLGVEKNRAVPHRKVEDLILRSGVPYTFLRPGFFMQNLSTTHAPEIRALGEILVPAGQGRTSFIDVRDIAEVAVRTLLEPGHTGKAYPLTGSEALTYGDVAAILTETLGRPIVYRSPSIFRFVRRMRARGFPWGFIGVMVGIYTIARLGLAGTLTNDAERLLGRRPISFREFARDFQDAWR